MLFMKLLKVLGVLFLFCLALGASFFFLAHRKYQGLAEVRHPDSQPLTLRIPMQESWLAEGERIARMRGCADCHGADLGGKVFIDDPGMGYFVGSNLTQGEGGMGPAYSVEDYVRAIRYGKNKEGQYLRFMPSVEYSQMTDEDLAKLIVYLESLPPVDRRLNPLTPGPIAKLMFYFDKMPLLLSGMHIKNVAAVSLKSDESAEYGQYLAASCTGCHRPDYRGGPIAGVPPSWPAASDLRPNSNFAKWTFEEFKTAMTLGETPDGRKMNPQFMPWTSTAAFHETELKALFNFLKSLPNQNI